MICDDCKLRDKCMLRALIGGMDMCLVFDSCSGKCGAPALVDEIPLDELTQYEFEMLEEGDFFEV